MDRPVINEIDLKMMKRCVKLSKAAAPGDTLDGRNWARDIFGFR